MSAICLAFAVFSTKKVGKFVCFCREFGYLGKLRTVINSDEHQHEQFMDRSIPF